MSRETADREVAQAASLREDFRKRFGSDACVFRAPGRVNLIGEHTDYNDGFVMPAAIDFSTWVAASSNSQTALRIYSRQYDELVSLNLKTLAGPPTGHWADYVRGVAYGLQNAGVKLCGADLLIDGQVPLGAGLSSSAALELSTATALLSLASSELPALDVVKLCQRAEHDFVGTRCGIMDQFISRFAKAGTALLLDCRSLEYEPVRLPPDVSIMVCNTMVKHALASGDYNLRRQDCEAGVQILRQHAPAIRSLRDVSFDELEAHRASLPERIYRRCRHVVTEIARTRQAADALRHSDLEQLGSLMEQSHESLRVDYEVSCAELDAMVEAAWHCEGVFGTRMTGGGFGGCTVAIVQAGAAGDIREKVAKRYREVTGISPDIYVVNAADGAGQVEIGEHGTAQ